MTLKLQFDPNQLYQHDAVENVARLFEGLPRQIAEFTLGDEIIPNLPPFESLSESWLYDNLRQIQQDGEIATDLAGMLDVDDGMVIEGVGNESWRHPSFTIEMETGTGKTYVAMRTIYELRKRYGFSKFIVVVPSIAIYEGWIKNFAITRDHFRALYENETVNLIEYDSARISQLRAFATSTFVEILVITLDSFNKTSNVIFKPSEKLPGERLPFEYIQQTRPILILDEPQNMESQKSLEALRTLHPLFSLRYSATHLSSPNLVYRLTPFDAYRLNLVKKIQVFGVTERENFNQPFLALEEITTKGGLKAKVRTYVEDKGRLKEVDLTLKHGDDLFAKTKRDEHKGGYVVVDVNAAGNFLEFDNGLRLFLNETIGPSRPEIFRAQIRTTIKQHMEMQQRMVRKNVKVLSLFFIDRVANYTAKDGIIRRIFDEEFNKLRKQYPFYEKMKAEEVRSAYFAAKKIAKSEETEAIDTDSRNQSERDAEKAAFELIMKDKETLLSFYDEKDSQKKVSFIFAHSALKEGWDNPNVFQICTLNQTVSPMKKRQEIGRGLRLAVNQDGLRVMEDEVNILSVIANESYQRYAETLQSEYVEEGQAPPPKPTNAGRAKVSRNEEIMQSKAFRDFWAKLQRHTSYKISIDTPALIKSCVERIGNRALPQSIIVVEKGSFIVAEYTIELASVSDDSCKLKITVKDTIGNESKNTHTFPISTDLSKVLHDDRLRGYKVVEIVDDGDNSHVVFGNGQKVYKYQPIVFQSEQGQKPSERSALTEKTRYPVFNLIDRAAKETGLTRPTLNEIFRRLSEKRKEAIFYNPEGFAGLFIGEINNAMKDHIAERIEFEITPAPLKWGLDLEDAFPAEKEFPQKELVEGSKASLYNQMQVDSDVEERFVKLKLNDDDKVVFYFKFPPTFKIDFPRIIGDYNPDWGIARYKDGKVLLELVRETKGGENLDLLRFPHEARKIRCAQKVFTALGVDYRVVTDHTADWWESEVEQSQMFR
ncbi:MAG: DEAD/DEAH box helicase [Anaerolineaceae bacterium]|nr:MAG: DEAD/DEAH box helicase [Anaerolineaceae bacterium]